jgi:hypothetical protein
LAFTSDALTPSISSRSNTTLAEHSSDIVANIYSDGDTVPLALQLACQVEGVDICPQDGRPVDDMLDLASHQTLVISVSFFSYWAAFISNEARVIAPSNFHFYPSWEIAA